MIQSLKKRIDSTIQSIDRAGSAIGGTPSEDYLGAPMGRPGPGRVGSSCRRAPSASRRRGSGCAKKRADLLGLADLYTSGAQGCSSAAGSPRVLRLARRSAAVTHNFFSFFCFRPRTCPYGGRYRRSRHLRYSSTRSASVKSSHTHGSIQRSHSLAADWWTARAGSSTRTAPGPGGP